MQKRDVEEIMKKKAMKKKWITIKTSETYHVYPRGVMHVTVDKKGMIQLPMRWAGESAVIIIEDLIKESDDPRNKEHYGKAWD